MSTYRTTIHADALQHNWRAIRRRATAKKIWAVIKSNGYGHGLLATAAALHTHADGLAVARIADALALRRAGYAVPILLLQGIQSEVDAAAVAVEKITTVIHSKWQLDALRSHLPQLNIYLKVNTGMNRLGFPPEDATTVLQQLRAARSVVLMTHFARADEVGGTAAAAEKFLPLRQLGYPVSMSNSAATLFAPDLQDDWARVGIALYGASPAPAQQNRDALDLCAAMTLRANLLAVQRIVRGDAVGYGGQFVAAEDMPVGIVGCGYGDGYPRLASGYACISGVRVPLAGRVSMDMLAVDLRPCPNAKVGDEVVLWGDAPSIDEVAASAGTIAYEPLTQLHHAT